MTDVEAMLGILVVLVLLLGWSVRKYYQLEQKYQTQTRIAEVYYSRMLALITKNDELRERYAAKQPEVVDRWEPS